MRAPALYTAPYEYGNTHPDLDEVLHAARWLTDRAEDERALHDQTSAPRILHGLAERTDLTSCHVEQITALESCDRTVLAALVTNPALDAAIVTGLFTHETLPYFLARPDVTDFADQIIRGCPHSSRISGMTEPEHHELIRARLGDPAIDDYFNRALADPDTTTLIEHAQHPMLTSDGFDRVLYFAEDSDTVHGVAVDILDALVHRGDLTDDQGLRLVAVITTVYRRIGDSSRWLLSRLIMNRAVPTAVMTKMVGHRAQWARDLALTMDHVRPETIFAAARSHQPHALMRLSPEADLPADVAHAVLDDLETGTVHGRGRTRSAEQTHRYVTAVLRHSPDPEIWDRALPLFIASRTEPNEGVARYGFAFSNALTRPATGVGSRVSEASRARNEAVLMWMSAHRDPHLRIATLGSLYLREQVLAATRDESEDVRAAVLFHALVDTDMVAGLVGDPSPKVRIAVAGHPATGEQALLTLNNDPDPTVRAAVADRYLAALTG